MLPGSAVQQCAQRALSEAQPLPLAKQRGFATEHEEAGQVSAPRHVPKTRHADVDLFRLICGDLGTCVA